MHDCASDDTELGDQLSYTYASVCLAKLRLTSIEQELNRVEARRADGDLAEAREIASGALRRVQRILGALDAALSEDDAEIWYGEPSAFSLYAKAR